MFKSFFKSSYLKSLNKRNKLLNVVSKKDHLKFQSHFFRVQLFLIIYVLTKNPKKSQICFRLVFLCFHYSCFFTFILSC